MEILRAFKLCFEWARDWLRGKAPVESWDITNNQILVDVTQDDIDRGKQLSSRECPIALAALRLGWGWVCVGPRVLVVSKGLGHPNATYDLPEVAQRFVGAFDAGANVVPFWFVATLRD